MADFTITERDGPKSHGSLWRETGVIDSDGGRAGELRTKLASLLYLGIQSIGGVADNGYIVYLNSASASATADDGGVAHITATLTDGDYIYEAYGTR